MPPAKKAQKIIVGEVRNVAVNFTGKLDAGEDLAGTPSVTEIGSTDLTFTNVAVSTGALTILDESVAAGRAVQFSVSGAQAGKRYDIEISVASTATPPQTLKFHIFLDAVA